MTATTTTSETTPAAPPPDRLAILNRLVARPEVGALLGAVVVFVFFTLITTKFVKPLGISTWLDDASTLGIMAVAVALLMIGGEFDLSTGVMTASTALIAYRWRCTRAGISGWDWRFRWSSRSPSARSTAGW